MLLVLLVHACWAPEHTGRAEVVESLGAVVVGPTWAEVGAAFEGLDASAQALCAAPEDGRVAASQDAWGAALRAWSRAEVLDFGAVRDARLRGKVAHWPIDAARIDALLAGDEVLDRATLANFAATVRGLYALEYLLFAEDGEASTVLTSLTSDALAARRCELLTAAAGYAADEAVAMAAAWRPGGEAYEELLSRSGDRYPLAQSALTDMVNQLVFAIEDTANMRVGAPLGLDNGGVAQPDLVEADRSGRDREVLTGVMDGFWRVYSGTYDDVSALGVRALVGDRRPALNDRITAQFEAIDAALGELTMPLAEAVIGEPAGVQAVYDALKALQRTLETELQATLNVAPGINDNDGD